MVKLDIVHALNTALVQKQPLVAVFFGGTSAIAHYTLRALATAEANGGKGFRAYIIGRKAQAAEEIISECSGICPQSKITFIQAEDLSLITEINLLCQKVIQLEEKEGPDARIDYLMMSQGGSIFLPRKDTKEGLDITMSLMYYSRMRIITNLLPLLLKSNLPAKVVSVYAAGAEDKLFPEDLSVRDLKRYSYFQARSHMVYFHTFFFESLAEQHRGKLGLVHIFPGLVLGPGYQNPELPKWFRLLCKWVLIPLLGKLITVPPTECGDRMLSLASPQYPPRPVENAKSQEGAAVGSDGNAGSGAYNLNWDGDVLEKNKKHYEKLNKDEMRRMVWDHTMRAFEVIESGKVFTE